MSKPRDTQRKKVYDSEHIAFGDEYWKDPPEFPDIEEVRDFVGRVTRSRWWKARGYRGRVRIHDGRGMRRGHAYRDANRIAMPVFTRRRWYVLHELAHLITPGWLAPHGPEFCAVYLELLKRFGEPGDADKLKAAFKTKRVRHRRPKGRS